MKHLKTEKCVICGKNAVIWHGHVLAKERMALGNFIDKKVIAGFCEEHGEEESDIEKCCYGEYDSEKMGKCLPLFNRNQEVSNE